MKAISTKNMYKKIFKKLSSTKNGGAGPGACN